MSHFATPDRCQPFMVKPARLFSRQVPKAVQNALACEVASSGRLEQQCCWQFHAAVANGCAAAANTRRQWRDNCIMARLCKVGDTQAPAVRRFARWRVGHAVERCRPEPVCPAGGQGP